MALTPVTKCGAIVTNFAVRINDKHPSFSARKKIYFGNALFVRPDCAGDIDFGR